MTKTLAELEAIVRFRGDFRNVLRFPAANVQGEIQAAFGEFYEVVVDTNEGYYDTTGTVSTVASTAFVAVPSGAWRIRGVDRLDGTDYFELCQVGIGERNRWGGATDIPRAYRLTARGIDLYPTPNAVYTLRVTYTPVAPTLDSTPREFYNGWEEYTIYGALLRLAGNEHSESGEWQKQQDFQRVRITRGAGGRKAQEPEYLNLHDGYESGDGRWWF